MQLLSSSLVVFFVSLAVLAYPQVAHRYPAGTLLYVTGTCHIDNVCYRDTAITDPEKTSCGGFISEKTSCEHNGTKCTYFWKCT